MEPNCLFTKVVKTTNAVVFNHPLRGQFFRSSASFWTQFLVLFLLLGNGTCFPQVPGIESKYWYFGTGTRGLLFGGTPIYTTYNPTLLTNKKSGVGYEGMVVVNDTLSGDLLFYSNGIEVVNKNHVTMSGGTGLFGHTSASQTVLCLPRPGIDSQFVLLHHAAFDAGSGPLYSTIVDFTTNPLGNVPYLTKNVLISNVQYSQGNVLISKPCTNDYWWVGHINNTNQYNVIPITSAGIGIPVTFTLAGTNTGDSYAMVHSPVSNKIAIAGTNLMGLGTLGLILANFDNVSGSFYGNAVTIFPGKATLGNFSPDGSKLYFNNDWPGHTLMQYDLNNGVTTNMNTSSYAHDCKVAPNGRMYFIHTYNSSTPIAVINCPNLSALGNACGYNTNGGVVGTFNGEVRRFPTFLARPYCPNGNEPTFPCTLLGYNFNDFIANWKADSVVLSWEINEPCQGCKFEIQSGTDAASFETIGELHTTQDLGYESHLPKPGRIPSRYKIVLHDANGNNSYSQIVTITASTEVPFTARVYPNPCSSELHLDYGQTGDALVEVVDLVGRVVMEASAINGHAKLDVSTLPQSTYLIRIVLAGKANWVRFQKL